MDDRATCINIYTCRSGVDVVESIAEPSADVAESRVAEGSADSADEYVAKSIALFATFTVGYVVKSIALFTTSTLSMIADSAVAESISESIDGSTIADFA